MNAPRIDVPRVRFELACGGQLVVSPRPGAPVTAARFHVRGGPRLDPDGRGGVAYLAGALADQGTASHDERELATLLEPEGGDVAGDAHGLGGAIAGGAWPLLLDVLAELLSEASYPDDRFAMQLRRLRTRLAAERDDPRAQAGRRFRRLVYGDTYLGRAPYGDLESTASIAPDDLRAHRAANWVGRRLVAVVVGDVDPDEVLAHLDGALAGLEPGAALPEASPPLPPREPRVDAFTRERNQVHVALGHLGIRRADPDFLPLVVMDHVLGTGPGFTNRITRRLRDELGLAYAVHADITASAGLQPGTFRAYIGTAPDRVATAVEGFLTEIRRIREEPVEPAELESAQQYLIGSLPLGFQRASQRAGYLVSSVVHGLPDDYLARLPELYAAVTAEDVQRVARAHLFPDACCLVAAGPVERADLEAMLRAAAAG